MKEFREKYPHTVYMHFPAERSVMKVKVRSGIFLYSLQIFTLVCRLRSRVADVLCKNHRVTAEHVERGNGGKKRPRVPPTVENDTDEPVKEF